MKGGGGLGDPLLATRRGGRARRRRGPHRGRVRRRASTGSPTATRLARGGSSAPGRRSSGGPRERERVLAGDLIEPVKVDVRGVDASSQPRWAAEFRGFWDLPEDFGFDVATPTVAGRPAAGRARSTPAGVGGRVPCRLRGRDRAPTKAFETDAPTDEETLEATCSTRSSRGREVKDIQSGIKDPDRFDKWVALLQERVAYDDPIVLPLGEGAEHRAPALGWRAGHPQRRRPRLLPLRRELEDARAVFVRDTDELLRRGLPEDGPLRSRVDGAARVLLPDVRPPARGRSGDHPATRWSTSSCPTSRASTAAGSAASFR